MYKISNKKSQVKKYDFILDDIKLNKAIDNCPVKAISFYKKI